MAQSSVLPRVYEYDETGNRIVRKVFEFYSSPPALPDSSEYSIQHLQDHPVHSLTTTISLAGVPQGAYILKVQINDRSEDWKIIKN